MPPDVSLTSLRRFATSYAYVERKVVALRSPARSPSDTNRPSRDLVERAGFGRRGRRVSQQTQALLRGAPRSRRLFVDAQARTELRLGPPAEDRSSGHDARMIRKLLGTSVACFVIACSASASAAESTASSDGTNEEAWRLPVASLGFVAAGTGTVLSFVSFAHQEVNGVELGVGVPLFVAGIVTMVVVLETNPHNRPVALTPSVQLTAGPAVGSRSEASRLSSESPGLTVTLAL